MSATWTPMRFEDLVEFHDHKRVPLSKRERADRSGPYPYYGAQGIIDRLDDYRFDGRYLLIAEDGENLNSRKLPVSRIAEGQFWVNNHAHVVRALPGVADDDFLRVAVEFHPFNGLITGAAQPKLSQANLKRLEVFAPEYEQQRQIGDAVRAVDGFIENNRRRIEILEEMARLLYRKWFVHFRFPGHEHVELVDSDLGPIPSNWAVAVMADLIAAAILEIGDGYRAKNSEFAGNDFAFVRVRNVREGYLDLAGVDYLPGPYGDRVGGKRARPGDCVISMKGTVGRMAFVGERTPPLIYSPQVSYWRSHEPERLAPEYLRLWMQSPVFVEQCARVKGATDMADFVNLRDQRAMRLVIPADRVHAAFVKSVSPLLTLSDNLRSQIDVLEEARDLLLPRLIAGEVDVSDLGLDLEPVA